jgi:hypothetical protein
MRAVNGLGAKIAAPLGIRLLGKRIGLDSDGTYGTHGIRLRQATRLSLPNVLRRDGLYGERRTANRYASPNRRLLFSTHVFISSSGSIFRSAANAA